MIKQGWRDSAGLGLLMIVVALPGVFWGVDFIHGNPFVFFSGDEWRYAHNVLEVIEKGLSPRKDYFYGFLNQGRPFYILVGKLFGTLTPLLVLMTARVLNLLLSAALVGLLYHLSLSLFNERRAALLSGLFLILSPLYVVESIIATPVISGLFWSYAVFLSSYLYVREGRERFAWFCFFSAAAAIAVKFNFVVLVPVGVVLSKERGRRRLYLWGVLLLIVTFLIFNRGFPYGEQAPGVFSRLIPDNYGARRHAFWMNPLMYGVGLIPGVGLPLFLMAIGGLVGLARSSFYHFSKSGPNRDRFFCLELPLLFYGAAILPMTSSFIRHALMFVPYLAMAMGWFCSRILERGFSTSLRRLFLGGLLLYQTVAVGWVLKRYVVSPYHASIAWVRKNIREGEKIRLVSRAARAVIPANLLESGRWASSLKDADYLWMSEGMTFMLRRSQITPLRSRPQQEAGYRWRVLDDPPFLQKVMNGETDFAPLVRWRVRELLPEFWAYKKIFGTYTSLAGDVTIYKRLPS